MSPKTVHILLTVTLALGCSTTASAPDATVHHPSDASVPTDLGADATTMDAVAMDAGIDSAVTQDGGADAPPGMEPEKGPWVLRVDTSRASVRWESLAMPSSVAIEVEAEGADGGVWSTTAGSSVAQEVTAAYGAGISGITQPDYAGTFYMNTVDLTGLAPATCYQYRVAGYETAAGRFCTMHTAMDRSTIRFMALGDTNPILGHTVPVVMQGLARNPEFVVHLGDLQYYSSILETWQVWMGLMPPLLRQGGDLQPCIGNHENELNNTEFANYYARFFDSPGFDGQLQWYHFTTGGVHFFSLSTEDDFSEGSAQLAWFTSAFAAAEGSPGYRFSIVFFHRPMYTVGDTDPEIALRASLGQIFATHAVPLVLSGHMHGYERFEVGPVTYITSGGGGGVIGNVNANVTTYPADALLRVASGPYYHSMAITIDATTLHGEAVDEHGVVQDMFTVTVPP